MAQRLYINQLKRPNTVILTWSTIKVQLFLWTKLQ